MRILLLTPPMTQLNTPYPATAYLTGFLKGRGFDVRQADPAIELVLKLLSKDGLNDIHQHLGAAKSREHVAIKNFRAQKDAYVATIDVAVRFLQGGDQTLGHRIATNQFLPQGPRFRVINELNATTSAGEDPLGWAFGALGVQDRAKFIASLYIDDLADVIKFGIDERFELAKYAERLAASAPSFDPLLRALQAKPTLVDQYLDTIVTEMITTAKPDVIGLTAPFPGNVYGAFRIAKRCKELNPSIKILFGGGYANTELRNLSEARVFDFVDYVTLDDGEAPILAILDSLRSNNSNAPLLRTFVREDNKVVFKNCPQLHDIPFRDTGTPDYEGLQLDKYISLAEMLNPMHRLWSDGRWNKLTLAHGCYWRGCSFCDITLDYISRFEDQTAERIVGSMQKMMQQTGSSGFHFVDEAAPPKTLLAMAKKIIADKVAVSWWGNIRFEKTFTPKVAQTLAESGCIAISGGLEVASDRLLKLMNKGVDVAQVARVTKAFTDAGVMVHAYLMYGFPTQTLQESVEALERVRQLFAAGCIQSAYWHRFAATVHSPVGRNPEKFGIKIIPRPTSDFAQNDVDFIDPIDADHDAIGRALHKAVYNFMHGVGLDEDVRFWFDSPVPKAKVPKNFVRSALSS